MQKAGKQILCWLSQDRWALDPPQASRRLFQVSQITGKILLNECLQKPQGMAPPPFPPGGPGMIPPPNFNVPPNFSGPLPQGGQKPAFPPFSATNAPPPPNMPFPGGLPPNFQFPPTGGPMPFPFPGANTNGPSPSPGPAQGQSQGPPPGMVKREYSGQ